jgi:hypothetical protein
VPHRLLAVQSTAHANAFVERFIGSVRRECFDHVIVFNEAGLKRLMTLYGSYYEQSRTHSGWTRTRHFPARSCRPAMAPSWRSPRSGGSIIATNGARPERPSRTRGAHRPAGTVRLLRQHAGPRTLGKGPSRGTLASHPLFDTRQDDVRNAFNICQPAHGSTPSTAFRSRPGVC